jgi:hypothetical protein
MQNLHLLVSRRMALWAALLLGLAGGPVLGGCGVLTPLETATRSATAPALKPDQKLEVRTQNGKVDIAADPARADTLITATVRATTRERLEAVTIVASEESPGVLVIVVEWPAPGRQNREGCDFEIRVPSAAAGVTVRTSNGSVTLAGAGGLADVGTSNGAIVLSRHAGTAKLRTSNGRITATGVSGEIDADTSNGRIVMAGVAGPVKADTSNGSVEIDLAEGFRGPVEIDTSNGSVTLGVPTSANASVAVRTSNGSVSSTFSGAGSVRTSRGRGTITIGTGASDAAGEIEISTSNGSVSVRDARPADAMPASPASAPPDEMPPAQPVPPA